MKPVHYRIATVTFAEESQPTWGTRSAQILGEMARWAREGWQISRLNASTHVRVRASGFRVLLERPLARKALGRSQRRD